ncbi:MAG: DUF1801 domain-containing protein [Saprospiraceae bacterium]|nr:DUF1801 domain-containing protein [Saprospiraceae bacterium]
MNTSNQKFKDVDEYISCFPAKIQAILRKIRSTIKKAAPTADERISYGMPFYEYGGKGYEGRLIYFGVFKNHIGLFITPQNTKTVPKEMRVYHVSKATYQFPLDSPFPCTILEKTVKALVKERDMKNHQKITAKNEKAKLSSPIDIKTYNQNQIPADKSICQLLHTEINKHLPEAESKVWHRHPVWFIDGNPIVGYSKEKRGMRLMFWSGASFDEQGLSVHGGKFKDASVFYNEVSEINPKDLKRWLKKSKEIQWDYKNIVKRKGVLERLK